MPLIKELLLTETRGRIEEWVRVRCLAATRPNGTTLCRVLGEFPCMVTLDDLSIAPHLVMHGYWETWITMCLAKRVKPGWQCVDVGAAFGYYTLLLAALGAEKIEAWEPNHQLRRLLDHTLGLNGLASRVVVQEFAAGAAAAEERFLVRDISDYGSAYIREGYVPGAHAVQERVRLRAIGETTTLERVDFVKIDAEGMEPEVWQGLGNKLPRAALIEWMPSRYKEPQVFAELLIAQRYRIGRVNEKGDVEEVSMGELLAATDWMALWLERHE